MAECEINVLFAAIVIIAAKVELGRIKAVFADIALDVHDYLAHRATSTTLFR